MRILIQRSLESAVEIDGEVTGQIDRGLVLLVGVCEEDTKEDAEYCARKVAKMRIFEDDEGKTNLALGDVGGSILSISQFTLYANTRKGNRPSFIRAARPEAADELYEYFNSLLREEDFEVVPGQFGAHMNIHINNDGPMTIFIDSQNRDL